MSGRRVRSARDGRPARARSAQVRHARARPARAEGDERVQARRARRAACVLAAGAVLLAAWGAVEEAAADLGAPGVVREALCLLAAGDASAEEGDGAEDAQDADGSGEGLLEALAALVAPSQGVDAGDEAPEAFQEEVLALSGREDVRVDEDAGIVGFTASGEAEEVFDALSAELEEGGWSGVDSGVAGWGTFVKGEGFYRWVAVACVQVGDAVSVVVQVESFEEET